MSQFKFNAEDLTEMKSFYQEELAKTLHRLNHINDVLSRLGAKGAHVEMSFTDVKSSSQRSQPSSQKRKYNKKRGPKSKWGKIIYKTITKADRPLTYDDITDFLMISEGKDATQLKNMKSTVQNTVFKLRKDNKVGTFSMGARTKYIAPLSWFDANGEVSEDYRAKVKSPITSKKPAPTGEKRKPGRPRKIQVPVAKVKTEKSKLAAKPKAVKKTAPKTKPTAKKAPKFKSIAAPPSPKSPPKAKPVSPKKKAADAPKSKAAKKAAPKKATAKKASPSKKAAPKKSKTPAKKPAPSKAATKSPTATKSKPSKTKAKKTASAGPRKLAMTKTVKINPTWP